MKYKFLLTLILLACITACTSHKKSEDITKKQQDSLNEFPFEFKDLSYPIEAVYITKISDENLTNYNEQLNKFLENEYDGKKVSYNSQDQSLNSDFELKDSFKIVTKNLYCREYFQTVTYIGEKFSHSGVACRVSPKLWKNLISIN
jgi:surface antigen